MVSLSLPKSSSLPGEGLRPVNLRTDLAPLADLIELVFASQMDQNGQAAVSEMRSLSHMGVGLNLLASMSELAKGITLGFVWIDDGRLVGNVSVYPAHLPASSGNSWIIANVAVHPDYRGRGIATQLMQAAQEMIHQRGGVRAILQVDVENTRARQIYERVGFVNERAWTLWWRSSTARLPAPFPDKSIYITRRRLSEWRAEYDLAAQVRPAEYGGIGWMRPLHLSFFRRSILKQLAGWLTLSSLERLVIRSENEERVLASMWIDSSFATSSIQLTLMALPEDREHYADALINLAVRRFGNSYRRLKIEHPADEEAVNEVLRCYHFRPQQNVVHMRWDVP